jgi:hypothetical protein
MFGIVISFIQAPLPEVEVLLGNLRVADSALLLLRSLVEGDSVNNRCLQLLRQARRVVTSYRALCPSPPTCRINATHVSPICPSEQVDWDEAIDGARRERRRCA